MEANSKYQKRSGHHPEKVAKTTPKFKNNKEPHLFGG